MNQLEDRIIMAILCASLIIAFMFLLSLPHWVFSGFRPCNTKGAQYLPATVIMCFLLETKGAK